MIDSNRGSAEKDIPSLGRRATSDAFFGFGSKGLFTLNHSSNQKTDALSVLKEAGSRRPNSKSTIGFFSSCNAKPELVESMVLAVTN
jgi:hypothetical protein